jgi:ppGpp synthetase/RelA/SpoT-type nucleotidyltranferase
MKVGGEEKIASILEQYKKVQLTYKEFSNTVKFILETLLKNNGFHYQVVSAREKDPESLERKLKDDSRLQKIPLADLDDLAGCRVIFYLDSDMQRFIEHIYKEFAVIKNVPKFSPDDYNAHHIVVNLNKDRLNLTEYSKFAGLRCEIQLTTVLYHAWSEMAHDITYKPQKELSEFDKPTFESLKKQFSEVMQNHIRQASYSFEFIYRQFEKLKQGKKVFDIQFLEGILKSTSNNELYEQLSLLHQYVQKFGDKTPKGIDIVNIVESALKKAKDNIPTPIKTVIGDLEGRHFADVATVCLDILSELKYLHIENIFDLLIRLSVDHEPIVRKKAVEILSKLASFNLHVLQKIGYSIQLFIVDQLEKWDNTKIIDHFEASMELASQLLKPSFEGLSMSDYKTVTLHFGPLPVDDNLRNTRDRIMSLLKRVYHGSEDLAHKIGVLQILQEASQTPHQGNYGDDLLRMIIEDTNTLIDFYNEILPKAENEIIKNIEEQSRWFIQRFGSDKLFKINQLHSAISSNKEYEIFRIFVGYDYRFPDELNWKDADKLRKAKIQEFVDDISEGKFNEWQKRVLSVVKNYLVSGIGEFQYFNIFLFEVGRQRPAFASLLIEQNEKELEPFLIHLIVGLWKSSSSEGAKDIVSKWIAEGKRLSVCASLFEYVEEVDIPLLKKIFRKANKANDADALCRIMSAIAQNYPKYKNLKSIFVGVIKKLTELEKFQWINRIWFRKPSILDSLTEKEFDVVLDSMVYVPDIDYHAETILSPVAEKYPKKLIQFFKKRVSARVQKQEKERYDAIPFSLHQINKPLQKHAGIVVPEIVNWFNEKEWLFQWEASHFLQAVFPAFDKVLENEMIYLIKKSGGRNAKIVISVLRAYKGEPFLHGVCKEFIKKYHSDKYMKEMFIVMSQTGVVSGEYGFVEAYKAKREEVQDWKKDKNKSIQSFVGKYEAYLDKRIIQEQKQADEDVELRKKEFA